MIIHDSLHLPGPELFTFEPESASTKKANTRFETVHRYYKYLWETGILKTIALRYEEHPNEILFIIDSDDLPQQVPEDMEKDFYNILTPMLFGSEIDHCHACGGASLSWFMLDYRDNGGTISKEFSCLDCLYAKEDLYHRTALQRHKHGSREASLYVWDEVRK